MIDSAAITNLHRSLPIWGILLLAICSTSAWSQKGSSPGNSPEAAIRIPDVLHLFKIRNASSPPTLAPSESNELIVLLAPAPPAPSALSVMDAINSGLGPIPGDLGVGNPVHAEMLATNPPTGRMLQLVTDQPDSPEARLFRYLLLRYEPTVTLDTIATNLSANPNVQGVGENRRIRYHVSPNDDLVGTGASFPNTAQWALHLLNFPGAWDWTTGHGFVAILDLGLQVNHEDLKVFGTDPVTGGLTLGPFREHLSEDIAFVGCGVDEGEEGDSTVGHGTHVSGIVAARPNNHRGTAGACWDCSIEMIRLEQSFDFHVFRAFQKVLTNGVQAVSMSFGLTRGPCSPGELSPFCDSLQVAANRDVLLVASAGNDLKSVEFPANDQKVIGVGGLEWIGVDPVTQTPIAQFWSEKPNCPLPPSPTADTPECGANSGPELDLAAPAKTVLSTVYTGSDYRVDLNCGDSLLPSVPGFGPCTGTSMSAPYVVGAAMLPRSVNPLLSRDDLYDILTSTASDAGNHTNETGFGYPNAENAVKKALGVVDGITLRNRLTPFFCFFGSSSNPDPVGNPDFRLAETWVCTTAPSTASGLLLPIRAEEPYRTAGPKVVPGYDAFPGVPACPAPCDTVPRASIYVFTTDTEPFPDAPALVPLYRLRYDPDIFRFCDGSVATTPARDFAYATTVAEVLNFKNNVLDANGVGYDLDGREGYIYVSCEGLPSCTPPTGTVKVYQAFNATRYDHAIFPESELAVMQADGYLLRTMVLGYTYPNLDTDGDTLIDGSERLIGTNPGREDTDCDGVSDGAEIGRYDRTQHQYGDPLLGPCWPPEEIFADGFESGDASRWPAVVQ